MANTDKKAVSFLEIILIALLVIGGMSIWALVDRGLNSYAESLQPREEVHRRAADVPEKQAFHAGVEARLNAVQAALAEEELELQRQSASIRLMDQTYPELASSSLPIGTAKAPPAVVQNYLDTLSKLEASERLAGALNARIAMLVSEATKLSNTLGTKTEGTESDRAANAQLELATKELAAAQDQLVAQQLALVEYGAQREALETAYPALSQFSASFAPGAAVPGKVWQSYVESKAALAQTKDLVAALTAEAGRLQEDLASASDALARAQHTAGQALARAQARFELQKRIAGLVITCMLVALLFAIVAAVLLLIGRGTDDSKMNITLLLGTAVVLLIVLIGYQVFGASAAALAAMVIGLVLFIGLARRQPKAKSQEGK